MSESRRPSIAVVDYGLGNIFSVRNACVAAGMSAQCTSDPGAMANADAIILPGVGAFGDAMASIRALGLVEPIRNAVSEGRVLLGICLGMQLLMETSEEFGNHDGLGVLPGRVVRFPAAVSDNRPVKVPHVGWTAVEKPQGDQPHASEWRSALLEGLAESEPMYFVHSYYVRPGEPETTLAESSYAGIRFCSALSRGNVIGCQFHPERSGRAGLRVYRNLAAMLQQVHS